MTTNNENVNEEVEFQVGDEVEIVGPDTEGDTDRPPMGTKGTVTKVSTDGKRMMFKWPKPMKYAPENCEMQVYPASSLKLIARYTKPSISPNPLAWTADQRAAFNAMPAPDKRPSLDDAVVKPVEGVLGRTEFELKRERDKHPYPTINDELAALKQERDALAERVEVLEKELQDAATILEKNLAIGAVKAIGLREVATGVQLLAERVKKLTEPVGEEPKPLVHGGNALYVGSTSENRIGRAMSGKDASAIVCAHNAARDWYRWRIKKLKEEVQEAKQQFAFDIATICETETSVRHEQHLTTEGLVKAAIAQARAEAIEECAKLANDAQQHDMLSQGRTDIAAAIRAMKGAKG